MSIAFESDKRVSTLQLFLRGMAFLAVATVVVTLLIAKSEGVFEKSVRVTAALVDVGDGLPKKSDVKYQGVLVGMVDSVTPGTGGGPNEVHINLMPHFVAGIPRTVTARVVPSNAFAVPSVQLVYNGPAAPLSSGARIPEDRSLPTVRLQDSLTALSRIVAATARNGTDPTLGILTTVEQASSGRGADALAAGTQLQQIVAAFNDAMAPDGTVSTLSVLSDALNGLRTSSPDLLAAVHDAVVPMRAVADRRAQLNALLTGGIDTSDRVATGLRNRTGTITDVTGKMGPVLRVLAEGGRSFPQMVDSMTATTTKFRTSVDPKTHVAMGKVIVELTPVRQYTRADCPRYGDLAGPSCTTDPVDGPALLGPGAVPAPALHMIGGNVGPVGSPQEQQQIATILGGLPNPAADLILGPLLRGNDATVTPAAPAPAPSQTGGQR